MNSPAPSDETLGFSLFRRLDDSKSSNSLDRVQRSRVILRVLSIVRRCQRDPLLLFFTLTASLLPRTLCTRSTRLLPDFGAA